MPIEIQYLTGGGIVAKGIGIVTGRDIIDFNNELYATEDKIANISYQLCDLTNIESYSVTTEEIRTIAEQDIRASILNRKMIIAVAGEKDVIYGLLRMWQSFSGSASIPIKVFRGVEDAKKWIEDQLHNRT